MIGWAEDAAGTRHAVIWQTGAITDLGLASQCVAVDINDTGRVVGTCPDGLFLWEDGVPKTIAFEPAGWAAYAAHVEQSFGFPLVVTPQDLTDLTAAKINEHGAIAAVWFRLGSYWDSAIVLDPASGCP